MPYSLTTSPATQPLTPLKGGTGPGPSRAPAPGTGPGSGNVNPYAGGMDPGVQPRDPAPSNVVNPNGVVFGMADDYKVQGLKEVNDSINAGFNRESPSPVAGLTTLGNVSNAGLAQAGNTNINTAQSNALTEAQLKNINTLNAQAAGQGPSLAALQAKQVGEQNIAGQMAMLGSQRGGSNSALGLRTAGLQKAAADQQVVQAATTGRAAEQIAAQQQLTGALSGTQGQVMQGAQAQAQLGQGTNLANMQVANQQAANNSAAQNAATLQQGTMAQQTALANLQTQLANKQIDNNQFNAMLQAQMTEGQNATMARENFANAAAGENTALYGINQKVAVENNAAQQQLIGASIGAGGTIIGGLLSGSDIRLKTNIKSGDRSIKSFMDKVGSKSTTSFKLWSE